MPGSPSCCPCESFAPRPAPEPRRGVSSSRVAPYRSRSHGPEERLALAQEKLGRARVEVEEAEAALRPLEAASSREVLRLASELAAAESRRDVAIEWGRPGRSKKKGRRAVVSVDAAIARVESLRRELDEHPVTIARQRVAAARTMCDEATREVADLSAIVRGLEEDRRRVR